MESREKFARGVGRLALVHNDRKDEVGDNHILGDDGELKEVENVLAVPVEMLGEHDAVEQQEGDEIAVSLGAHGRI